MSTVTTEYAFKRCQNVGFLNNFGNVKTFTTKDQRENVFCLTDLDVEKCFDDESKLQVTNELDDLFNLPEDEHVSIYIELAKVKDSVVRNPISLDNFSEVLMDNVLEYVKGLENNELEQKLIRKFQKFASNHQYFNNKELKKDVLDALYQLHTTVHDTDFQQNVQSILRYNNDERYKEIQLSFEEETIKIYPHTKPFEDVRIATDSNKRKTNNKAFQQTSAALSDSTKVNKMIQLQAFSSNMFVVIHGKKNCPLTNIGQYQNHEIIESLFKNGVHTTPINTYDTTDLSIYRLVKALHRLRSFDIIFIHPNLAIPGAIAEAPCEDIQPSYDICCGEILAIMYRYIAINFFPYCSIYDNRMEQLGFII